MIVRITPLLIELHPNGFPNDLLWILRGFQKTTAVKRLRFFGKLSKKSSNDIFLVLVVFFVETLPKSSHDD